MPAHGLAKLIEQLHPGIPVRELARRADVPVDRIAHYLKPGTPDLNRLPTPETMRETARMLGCPLADVVRAFNESLAEPMPWGDNLTSEEALMLSQVRALTPHEQRTARAVVQTLWATSDARSAPAAPPAVSTAAR